MVKKTYYYLPEEVLIEILKRLPVKHLLRFRCVSKSWCFLISSPDFITTHMNYNTNNNPLTLLKHYSETHKTERYTLHNDNDKFDVVAAELEFPFRRYNLCFRVVGSCNGLICLGNGFISYSSDLFLWNPSIKKILTLPTPRITLASHGAYMLVLGFGFDPKSCDYKVVRIVYLQGKNGFNKVTPEVEIYELSTGSWRGISSAVLPPYEMCNYSLEANMNGALHWVAFNSTKVGGFRSLIVALDLSDEVFKEIRLPRSLACDYPESMSIAACGESLSLFHYHQSCPFNWCCGVWVMEEYGVYTSWNKLFNIDLMQGVGAVLGSRKNGELLVVTVDGDVVSYDPDEQQVKDLGIRGITLSPIMRTCSLYVNTYMESLVLLDGTHGVLGYEAAPDFFREEADEFEEHQ